MLSGTLADRVRSVTGLNTGYQATDIPGVGVFYSETPTDRVPFIYESGILFVQSGRKRLYLADKVYVYDPDHYLVVGLPVAPECETIASKEEPIFGLCINADVAVLSELAATVAAPAPPNYTSHGIEAVPIGPDLRDAVGRLMTVLCSKEETAILGPGLRREILYRVLRDSHGAVLHKLINRDGAYARVSEVMRTLHADCATRRSVQEMARAAGMSESAFHRAFKLASGDTPLQYQKKVRLMRAGSMIVHDRERVSAAAFAVGYESAAQFSRDFKRYFGVNAADARRSGLAVPG